MYHEFLIIVSRVHWRGHSVYTRIDVTRAARATLVCHAVTSPSGSCLRNIVEAACTGISNEFLCRWTRCNNEAIIQTRQKRTVIEFFLEKRKKYCTQLYQMYFCSLFNRTIEKRKCVRYKSMCVVDIISALTEHFVYIYIRRVASGSHPDCLEKLVETT